MTWRQGNVQSIGVDEISGAPAVEMIGMVEYSEDANGKMQERRYELPADDPFFKAPNLSGIHPTEFRVLVLPTKVEEKTRGGIIRPQETQERDQYAVMEATIIECSPLAFTYESNWPEGAHKPKAGDRVVIAKYSGAIIRGKDGVEYKLVADKDVAAVLE